MTNKKCCKHPLWKTNKNVATSKDHYNAKLGLIIYHFSTFHSIITKLNKKNVQISIHNHTKWREWFENNSYHTVHCYENIFFRGIRIFLIRRVVMTSLVVPNKPLYSSSYTLVLRWLSRVSLTRALLIFSAYALSFEII